MNSQAPSAVPAKSGKYLTFKLANEVYGVEILHVREIIGMVPITGVPNTPASVKGVINLRGKIVPVVELRIRFGMPCAEYTRETCIIFIDIKTNGKKLMIGIIVDSVCEVVPVEAANIEPPPSFGVQVDTTFLLGMARANEQVCMLLDIERVLSQEETEALQNVENPNTEKSTNATKA